MKVKINPNLKRLNAKQLASNIIQASIELNRKLRVGQFEKTEEEPKQEEAGAPPSSRHAGRT